MSTGTPLPDPRVFGRHEAAAMFESIGNALAVLVVLGSAGVSGEFLRELQAEREMLVDERTQVHLALLRDRHRDPATAIVNALRVIER